MLDNVLLREHTDLVAEKLARRGFHFDAVLFRQLEEKRKTLQVNTQNLQNARNTQSKAIGQAKAKGENVESLMQEVAKLGAELDTQKAELDTVLADLEKLIMRLPNIPHDSVPPGKDEQDNTLVRTWGEIPRLNFPVKSHDELGEALGQMNFALAAKITGSRFVVLQNQLAKLHRALIQFMLDVHTTEHGYQEIYVPYMVNKDSLMGTGQLPALEEDLFKLAGDSEYYLIPTSEVPVTNLVRNTILNQADLPLRFVCHTPCFRSEAGSYGKDTKGMIRQHQFEKVELLCITAPDASWQMLETLTNHAETILQKLELPYRVMTLCAGDIGNCSAKTYDIEVWLPSQNTYREISSCSNFEAYQARRMKARYRDEHSGNTELVHTLNGSGLAVGRTLVAIMENYQDKDGNITIPKVLRPYMGDITVIQLSKNKSVW